MSENMKIFDHLKSLVMDMKDYDDAAIHREATFEDLELDSLDFVEIQVAVKKRYRVDLIPDLFTSGTIANLGQLADFIESESTATQS